MVGLIVLELFIVMVVAAIWVRAIDETHTKHPDYKGEDFLNEEEKKR